MGRWIIGVIKFFVGILLIPVVIACTLAFRKELLGLGSLYGFFVWGMLSYVIFHLFIFTPQRLYQAGQRVFTEVFSFFPEAAAALPLCIPLLTTTLLLILYICSSLGNVSGLEKYFMFLTGFTLALHVILTAQDIYDEDGNAAKPRYLFSMTLVYLVNICLIVLLVDLNFEKFSSWEFLKGWEANIKNIFERLIGYIT